MDTTAKFNTPPLIATDAQWRTEPPTQPGTYWMRRDPPSRDILVHVRETNGELTVWWPDRDQWMATTTDTDEKGGGPMSDSPLPPFRQEVQNYLRS